jgi:hypothetical protein
VLRWCAMPDILQLLIEERDKIEAAIAALGGARRRGRPPGRRGPGRPPGSGKKTAAKKAAPKRKGMSAAQRKAASERMRKYWAARKKGAK